MKDENNETFKHDTEFHEFRTAVAAGADLQRAMMTNEMTCRVPPNGSRQNVAHASYAHLAMLDLSRRSQKRLADFDVHFFQVSWEMPS